MMVFSPINEEVYDVSATQVTYCKIFPHMLEDFITRHDAKKMMDPKNLPFNSDVVTNAGQAVSVAVPAGTGSTVSPGKGKGSGRVTPVYDGTYTLPEDEALKREKKALEDAGGQAASTVLETALGG